MIILGIILGISLCLNLVLLVLIYIYYKSKKLTNIGLSDLNDMLSKSFNAINEVKNSDPFDFWYREEVKKWKRLFIV